MYAQFFGLKHEPFSIAPDPRYLYMSERHREALAHLLYGVRGGGGFVVLTGEIGAGKTTVCRCFLEQVPERCHVAYVFNPKLSAIELLEAVCREFRVPCDAAASAKAYVDELNRFLLAAHAAGQSCVLIIDEAQNLSADVLEQLRLLTNLETNERKLLQIVLIGQPELRHMLARPELEQLAQRVVARFHLEALSEGETAQYLRHRLAVAGLRGPLPFDRAARRRIHALARGVPRRINLLADRALLGAYAGGKPRVGRDIVDRAAREVFDGVRAPGRGRRRVALWALAATGGVAVAGAIGVAVGGGKAPPPAIGAAASAPVAAAPADAAPGASAASAGTIDPALGDERAAWRELAQLWGLPDSGGADPCVAAQQRQVQCFRGSTTLAVIRQLDRPGIVTLRDAAQPQRATYVVLTGLTPRHATVRAAGATQTVPLLQLARLWRGDFATYWRAPPGWRSDVGDAHGALAGWLAGRLAALDGEAPVAPGAEAALRAKVSAFQLAQGLKPDGLAGPLTLMQINRASGVDEPHLAAQR